MEGEEDRGLIEDPPPTEPQIKNEENISEFSSEISEGNSNSTTREYPQYYVSKISTIEESVPLLLAWNATMVNLSKPGPKGAVSMKEKGPLFALSDLQVKYLNFNFFRINVKIINQEITQKFHNQRKEFMNQYSSLKDKLFQDLKTLKLIEFGNSHQFVTKITHDLFSEILRDVWRKYEQVNFMVIEPLRNSATYKIISILEQIAERNFTVKIIEQANTHSPYVNLIFVHRYDSPITLEELFFVTSQKLSKNKFVIKQVQYQGKLLIFVDVLSMLKITPRLKSNHQPNDLMRKATIMKFIIHFDENCYDQTRKYFNRMSKFLKTHSLQTFYQTFLGILTNDNLLDTDIDRRYLFIMIAAYYMEFKPHFKQKPTISDGELFVDMIHYYGTIYNIEKTLINYESARSKFLSKKDYVLYWCQAHIGLAMVDPDLKEVIITPSESLKIFCWMQRLVRKIHEIKLEIVAEIKKTYPHLPEKEQLSSMICNIKERPSYISVKQQLLPF